MGMHVGARGAAAQVAHQDSSQSAPATSPLEAALRQAAVINAALLKFCTFDLEGLDVQQYHAAIDGAIAQLDRARTAATVRVTEKQIALDTQRHLREQEALLRAREEEFAKTIRLLTDAVLQFRDTNAEFTAQVMSRSDRMGKLVAVDDLRSLRSALEHELSELRQSAVAKQNEDLQHVSALSAKVAVLEERLAEAMAQAGRDGLTGLSNRAAWNERMEELGEELSGGKRTFALAMIDMDRFKSINDTYGHRVGDEVLARFAEICRKAFGAQDFVARYGGDEFLALLAAPTLEKAVDRINMLLDLVHDAAESATRSESVHFTISVGLAHATPRDDAQTLLNRADRALYAAKKEGRDRLVIAAG